MSEKIKVPKDIRSDYKRFLSGLSKVLDKVYTCDSDKEVKRAKVFLATKVSILVNKAYSQGKNNKGE